ncbi:lysine--tRNA ligase [candidate division Kazan bacterium RBG_13_50_9]|uniref:Lysine--tRNA ligase n=1 Tax=candidate division Kazan bacterium RBG_13_50_9 TaxID=1798535 RepID=A0A1F4NRL0_UNCK3|nr:MAG: lysine--tRNA ligase [candidate division Kazan bacterium RBG_13_50_9]
MKQSEESLRNIRIGKLEALKDMGLDPYPALSRRSHTAAEAGEKFRALVRSKKRVTLAGRLMSKREHGGLIFAELKDGSSQMQVLFKKDEITPKLWDMVADLIDIGDFIEASGFLFLTKRKEKTLMVKKFTLLAKALRPLPEKWHGLTDHETRFRQRYLDLLMNPEVKERFIIQHKLVQALRGFLVERGFIEVETPALQPLPGGALATPFKTRYDALNTDVYLRIAPELYLKRLIIGGFERVFEFARVFRNEGVSTQHLQDFTMLEFYQAYATHEDLMKLTEGMLGGVVKKIFGSTRVQYGGRTINFATPWPVKSLRELIKKETGVDIDEYNTAHALQKAIQGAKIRLTYKGRAGRGKLIDELYKETVRPKLTSPVFVIDHPLDISPLAKRQVKSPQKVQRFQLVVAGMEVVNAFSELNDPLDQRERFREQAQERRAGDKEAHSMDEDFVKALEYGMPPTAGWGMGVERLVAILTDADSIREAVLFPFVKSR